MNEQENAKTVQEAYNNFNTGNIQALLDQMYDNVTWELPEIEGVALAGKRTGRDGVKEIFETLARDQDVLEFEPLESLAQGDKVVSLGHYKWRVKDNRREESRELFPVFTLNQAKVT